MNNHKFLKNLYIGLVFFFLFLPIIVLIIFSFNTSKMNIIFEGFTLKWYHILFTNKELLDAFKNTIILTLTSTVVSTIIGTLAAIGLKKFDFKGKTFINGLLYIPIVIPEIVLGIALLAVYSLLKLELGMGTLILAHVSFSIPFVIISVRSSLENTNPFLESAANDLGADNWNTFKYVTIPNAFPGIRSGALLALTLSLDDVVISFFTSGPNSTTFPLKIYSMIKTGVSPDVNALSTLMLLAVIIILTISTIIETKNLKKLQVRR